mgnify:CR=1 FL=1
MKILKIIILIMLVKSFVFAGPAFPGVRTFTQPDGTKFEGVLKGDSSFHWIESDGSIIIMNPTDKFYYKATIDANNSLNLTSEKPANKTSEISASSGIEDKKHDVSQEDRKKLYKLYKKSKVGNYPR